ncbi:hypothetical protein [Salinibaculum rarum]|uniref:hypothetical protein n=1 Tax=Salinibaculum rarum TaxID=3058903 RepID=UPI00265FDC32|nr:hypothetical protein [Salinibaculum sp. KK48]
MGTGTYRTIRDLRGDDYHVERDGEEILSADLAEFTDGELKFKHDDQEVFRVERTPVDDGVSFLVIDTATGDEIAALVNTGGVLGGRWEVRDPTTGTVIVSFKCEDSVVNAVTTVSQLGKLKRHEYAIVDVQDGVIGAITATAEKLTVTHEITIDADASVTQELVLAAATVFDAVQSA